ncbi:hypothetical protein F4553_007887 [Allocatelliglobosispora scoriae]|uniref:DUF998 domain-containing protein n=1 Tax=Allocatelliglobosispora scoriae TaxID=643052 RepID=A0A841C5P5_9ACTN|nr:DUF998 domain-containing protein [Allocatelliglobosispora scoriae]MBB5874453.1 hypothetical protein [Allocatelliglobosispora scoriae]
MATRTHLDALTVRRLRRGVGTIAIILPIAVTIGNSVIQGKFTLLGSVSGAYHSGMRDWFVGSLCAMGVFLICYRYAKLDDWLSTIAGTAAILVALFPTKARGEASTADLWIWWIHLAASVIMFATLAVFCFFVFTRTYRGIPKQEAPGPKRKRNAIYIVCGWAIIGGLGLGAGLSAILPHDIEVAVQPLFWGESIAIWAFGTAWLAKGDAIIRDNAGEDVLPEVGTETPAVGIG